MTAYLFPWRRHVRSPRLVSLIFSVDRRLRFLILKIGFPGLPVDRGCFTSFDFKSGEDGPCYFSIKWTVSFGY